MLPLPLVPILLLLPSLLQLQLQLGGHLLAYHQEQPQQPLLLAPVPPAALLLGVGHHHLNI